MHLFIDRVLMVGARVASVLCFCFIDVLFRFLLCPLSHAASLWLVHQATLLVSITGVTFCCCACWSRIHQWDVKIPRGMCVIVKVPFVQ